MLRPGSAVKRMQNLAPGQIKGVQAPKEIKIPSPMDFLASQDYVGAITLFELERKFEARDDYKNKLWLAYAYFHNGDYDKAIEIYNTLMKIPSYDPNLHTWKACCLFGLCTFKEAAAELAKAPDSDLRNRLMLHVAQKLNDEKTMMKYHDTLKDSSVPDQLCLAALHYLRGHYEDASEIYKKINAEYKEYAALYVYMALCYYKLD